MVPFVNQVTFVFGVHARQVALEVVLGADVMLDTKLLVVAELVDVDQGDAVLAQQPTQLVLRQAQFIVDDFVHGRQQARMIGKQVIQGFEDGDFNVLLAHA